MHPFFSAVLLCGSAVLGAGRMANAEAPTEAPSVGGTPPTEKSRPPHPEPRVIVKVTAVQGPHNPAKVQHAARFGWKRIVSCYKASGAREKAIVNLELVVSAAGSVAGVRSLGADPKHRELATCLAGKLHGLTMPKAAASSMANVEIKLAPGDPPPKNQKPLEPNVAPNSGNQ